MNFSELQTAFYDRFSENATSSRFNATKVKSWLNEGYRILLSEIKKNDTDKVIRRTNVYTLCSDAGSSTGTTLYVDSVSGMQKGQYLVVSDETHFETVQIASISALTVTLVSPGLVNTYTDGDYVASNQIWLPGNFLSLHSIIVEDITSTDHSANVLNQSSQIQMETNTGYINSKAMPTNFYISGCDYSYGNVTAGAGTTTTVFASTGLSAHEADYYVDWIFTNQIRSAWARVTASAITPAKTLTLDTTIASQTSGDSCSLRRQLYSVFFNTMPDKQYAYRISYNASSPNMVNAYDIPILEERHHQVIVDYALMKAAQAARRLEEVPMFKQDYFEGLARIKQQYYCPTDGSISIRTAQDVYDEITRSRYGR